MQFIGYLTTPVHAYKSPILCKSLNKKTGRRLLYSTEAAIEKLTMEELILFSELITQDNWNATLFSEVDQKRIKQMVKLELMVIENELLNINPKILWKKPQEDKTVKTNLTNW